ncbi:MAG: cytochrome c [Cyclobacteriaceae bacterium]|nr:cytochrome c [Cyclobacteriaceae bacterium]
MYTGIYHSHKLAVILFLLIYTIKLILLFVNTEKLDNFSKKIKVPDMIISFLFLATGIYLATQSAEISTILLVKFGLVLASIPLAIIGFKKHKKSLAIVSVLLIFTVYGLSEMNRGMKAKKVTISNDIITNPSDANYDELSHGKVMFLSQCAMCHGPSGDQGLSGAKNLLTSTMKLEEVMNIITKGKNSMPKYSKSLSENEIKVITAYVMTLRE